MEQGNDGALELGTTAGVDRGRGECLPHDGLADVGSNEEGNTASETIALLQELIEQDNNHTSHDKLEDQKEDNASAEVRGRAVETSEDVNSRGTGGEDEGEELLGGLVKFAIGLEVEVDVNHVGASEELEDHAGGDNRRNTQFHQRSSITRHHHSQPV